MYLRKKWKFIGILDNLYPDDQNAHGNHYHNFPANELVYHPFYAIIRFRQIYFGHAHLSPDLILLLLEEIIIILPYIYFPILLLSQFSSFMYKK